jgi:hypothetical protein
MKLTSAKYGTAHILKIVVDYLGFYWKDFTIFNAFEVNLQQKHLFELSTNTNALKKDLNIKISV